MIDLTVAPVSVDSCYRPYLDPELEHQLQIHWVRDKGKTVFTSIEGICNCGTQILVFKPEEDRLQELNIAYAEHVESLL